MTSKQGREVLWHLERVVQAAKMFGTDYQVWNLARLTDCPQLWEEAHQIERRLIDICDEQRACMDKILDHFRAARGSDQATTQEAN